MNIYQDQITGLLTVKMSVKDLGRAEKALSKYMNRKGPVYEEDPKKEPNFKRFCAIYFTAGTDFIDYEAFRYTDFPYLIPDVFLGTNKNVLSRIFTFLKPMEYHDIYNQVYCDVSMENNSVFVKFGNY